ncbi:MAG: PTS sugar transporter subunit IIA [Spirochaetales bacterium]|nr:PTS sugar transporter subunit IIA [Spirochaetales bacterium]
MLGCFRGGTVVQSLSSHDKFDAIRELIHKAPVFSGLGCRDQLEEAVVQREKILSTGLGRGVAVAHGTTDKIDDIIIALGISEQGIDFDSFDKTPVHLLFVITNPPGRQMEYLVALSTVTRLVRDEAFRESLRTTAPARDIELKICQAFSECLDRYGGLSN